MSDETGNIPAPDTEVGADAPNTVVYAWSAEADNDPAQTGERRWVTTDFLRRLRPDGRIVPAVIAAVTVIAVAGAGMLVFRPQSSTRHYSIAQVPIIQRAAPPEPAAPKPASPKPAPVAEPPVAAPPPAPGPAPPVAVPRPQLSAPAPVPLTPSQKFNDSLQRDGMHSTGTPAQNDYYAEQMCRDLSHGGNPDEWAQNTEQGDRLEPGKGAKAVHDAIESYCPQFG